MSHPPIKQFAIIMTAIRIIIVSLTIGCALSLITFHTLTTINTSEKNTEIATGISFTLSTIYLIIFGLLSLNTAIQQNK